MAIVGLDRQQGFAFISEMTSTRNLLAYGVRAIRTGAFSETTRDPILTMLSIGVEKLYKLTIGLVALDTDGAWPSQIEGKRSGHSLGDMHAAIMDELRVRTADKSEYVRGLFAEVEADPVIVPLIVALDMYGRMGRFYYLDLLGDQPQVWESPDTFWQRIESAAIADPVLAAMYTEAMEQVSNNDLWDASHRALNELIAASLERLWVMVAVVGRNHALGETGGTFGFEIHPGATGRQ